MPYDSVADAPAHVQKLPPNKARQWVHVFNSCISSGGDEAKCFREANGVTSKEASDMEPEPADTPSEAPVTPPASPELVLPLPAPAPPRVSLWEKLRTLVGGAPTQPVTGEAFALVKQADGKLRWFARYSNSWLDRDSEIITSEAHKEYIGWAYDTGTFPELWMWHTPGTRIGEADWLDYADGFAHASGTIDNGKESVVEKAVSRDTGVSHGFLSLQAGKYIQRYRSYEISVLPREYAAVATTGFNLLKSAEGNMPFTGERRAYLVSALGEEMVKGLESNTEQTAEQLKQLGVEFKAAEETKEATEAEKAEEGFKALAEQVATLTATVGQLAGVVAEQKKSLDGIAKSDDEKIEDAFLARVAKAFGQNGGVVRPTESPQNVEASDASVGTKSAQQTDFFSTMIAEQFGLMAKQAPSGSVGSATTGAVTVTPETGPTEVRGE